MSSRPYKVESDLGALRDYLDDYQFAELVELLRNLVVIWSRTIELEREADESVLDQEKFERAEPLDILAILETLDDHAAPGSGQFQTTEDILEALRWRINYERRTSWDGYRGGRPSKVDEVISSIRATLRGVEEGNLTPDQEDKAFRFHQKSGRSDDVIEYEHARTETRMIRQTFYKVRDAICEEFDRDPEVV